LDEEQGLYIDYVSQIEKLETPDEHTVVFKTKDPSVQMLSMLVYILPKHIWEDVPADETKTFKNSPAIGIGPFQAVEWKEGQSVRLEGNPDYFRGAPHIEEIIFQLYDNDDTMVKALKNGEVNYIQGRSVDCQMLDPHRSPSYSVVSLDVKIAPDIPIALAFSVGTVVGPLSLRAN
jgi:peptide/nickel transport system substrate-binding protein